MKFQILIRFSLLFFCLSMMISFARADMHKGIEWYQKRHSGSIGMTASVEAINQAIEYFTKAMNANPNDIRHYLWLGKSYYANYQNGEARDILETGMKIKSNNESDRILKNQIRELLSKL